MKCAWKELLAVLPLWLRESMPPLAAETLEELRLRRGEPPWFVMGGRCYPGTGIVGQEDLNFCVSTASRYSPWTAQTAAEGFLTAPGGHRIGLCGEAVIEHGQVKGMRNLSSLCIRVARDFSGIATAIEPHSASVLLIGPPGSGKTTLLRDLIRCIGRKQTVAVVDERRELFPEGTCQGAQVDVLSGCPKPKGIEMALRTMSPAYIAVDEITAQEDCTALVQAGWCGVKLLATAHAHNRQDLTRRPIYQKITECGLFDRVLTLGQDKHWREERMNV